MREAASQTVRAIRRLRRTARRRAFSTRTLIFLRRSLDLEPPRFRSIKAATFGPLNREDIQRIPFISEERRQTLDAYFDAGCEGWQSSVDGEIVSFHFSSDHPILEDTTGEEIPVQPGQHYQFDGVVAPGKRGLAIAVSHMLTYWEIIRSRGASEVICFVERGNRSSERLHRRLGFTPYTVLEAGYRYGFPFKLWREPAEAELELYGHSKESQ